MRGVLHLLLEQQQLSDGSPLTKKVCVKCVTDMEFDEADDSGKFRTTIEVIHRDYAAAGMDVPLLLLHNARGVDTCPFDPKLPGVICISGFSTDMLSEIMDMLGTGDIRVPTAQGVSEVRTVYLLLLSNACKRAPGMKLHQLDASVRYTVCFYYQIRSNVLLE